MIYGFIEDNLIHLISSYKKIDFNTAEIFTFKLVEYLSIFIDSLVLINYLIFFIATLNLVLFYLYFKNFFKSFLISSSLTLIISLSPFLLYKSQNHLALLNVWILPTYILLCLKLSQEKTKLTHFFLNGIIFGITTLISNYLGFFGLLFSVIYLAISYTFKFFKSKFDLKFLKDSLIKLSVLYLSILIPILLVNYQFLYANFISDSSQANSSFVLKRSIDEFFIFSSRPWYYFLPSVDNPFYGEYSKNILNYLENDWGSFLAKNYFKSEHSSSYLGITNFILAIIGFFYLRRNKEKIENYTQIIILGITGIILVLFTMPPYLEIGSFRFYFPSYLIAEYFPMFRVTARLGILILIIQLVFTGFGFKYILDRFNELNIKKTYSYLIIIVLTFISLSEFFIPFKFTDISQIPDVFNYIKENTSRDSRILVMPGNKYSLSLFWSKDHNRELVFLNNLNIDGKNISYDDFVNKYLYTCQGLIELKNKDIDYFVYFYNTDNNSIFKRDFLNNNLLKVKEFTNINQIDEFNSKFYKIIYTGNNFSNQSIIYQIPSDLNCK